MPPQKTSNFVMLLCNQLTFCLLWLLRRCHNGAFRQNSGLFIYQKNFLFALLFLLFGTGTRSILAQKRLNCPNVKIYESNALVYGVCEPSIAINRISPQYIAAGSIMDKVYISSDGGLSWKADKLSSPEGVYGDPCVISDRAGNFYYLHLGNPDGGRDMKGRLLESIVIQKSKDNGQSWSDGTPLGVNPPKDQDKEWAVANPSNDDVYVVWTEFDEYGSNAPDCFSRILFTASSDLGESWSETISISSKEGDCLDGNETPMGAMPAVGPDGNLYVTWSQDYGVFFTMSSDGGNSWLDENRVIAPQYHGSEFDIPGMFRANGLPSIGTDQSDSKFHGSVYVCWGDSRGEDYDIFFALSRDKGTTWSEPILVNKRQKQNHQFFPWMSIDPTTGYIYIVYYDQSGYQDGSVDVSLAISKNGGKKFKNYVISESPFKLPGKFLFFGDYNNLDAFDGQIRPIWTRYEKGKMSIWTALIEDK